jgi:hypothetical protein
LLFPAHAIFAKNKAKGMITVIQQPPAYYFTSGIGDVILQSPAPVTFTLKIAGVTVLQEIYAPDASNRIYIRSLDKVINRYLKTALIAAVQFIMTESAQTITIDTTAQYCTANVDVSADQFRPNYYLTMLQDRKITSPKQKEYLSLVVTEATTVTAKAKYLNGTVSEKTLANLTQVNIALTVDVSPSKFSNPQNIAYYVVLAGGRYMEYFLRPELPADATQFIFLNAFGVKETFIPLGLVNRENKYENLFGFFTGKHRKYSVDLIKEYTANTGIMDENMAAWIEDMFVSRDVFLLTSAGIEKEVSITEATVKRSSAMEELPAFEFKYRLSQVNQHDFRALSRVRIFDDTFDYTYN